MICADYIHTEIGRTQKYILFQTYEYLIVGLIRYLPKGLALGPLLLYIDKSSTVNHICIQIIIKFLYPQTVKAPSGP
jgi:hypothetical protein